MSLVRITILVWVTTFILAGCTEFPSDCKASKTCDSEGGSDGDGGTSGGGSGTGAEGGSSSTGDCDPLCTGDKPVCDGRINECVECLEDDDCSDSRCDKTNNTCGGCLEDSHCTADAPVCGGGSCAGCSENADCESYADTPACDTESGACVECTPATEADDCGATSCDPATLTCGPHDRDSRGTCRSCVSDSDCVANHHCVPMEFPTGTAREGGYCLELFGACAEPYTVVVSDRTSLSGVSDESYCGINEDLTTCEAVRALEDNLRCDRTGPGDGQCWPADSTVDDAVEVPGALCRKFEGFADDRCTYECAVTTECLPTGPASTCGAGTGTDPVTPDFCGGQDM